MAAKSCEGEQQREKREGRESSEKKEREREREREAEIGGQRLGYSGLAVRQNKNWARPSPKGNKWEGGGESGLSATSRTVIYHQFTA